MLTWLRLEPLLDLNMRLGEGTGAVLAINILQAACRLLAEMSTFGDAGVSGRRGELEHTTSSAGIIGT